MLDHSLVIFELSISDVSINKTCIVDQNIVDTHKMAQILLHGFTKTV